MIQHPITHYRYVCRTCQGKIFQPVSAVPADTPSPTCCKKRRDDMAYVGVVYEGQEAK